MPTVLESLNHALHDVMADDPRVHVMGEDILDPYGGAFKVTKGLATNFPDRVMTTPVSEAGIVGIAAGMALRGMRPVVEIMFGDFTTLVVDQLVNHAAKYRWMYNDQVDVPLVVRTPMGGRRGYGPTHSQSLEKLFLGVPGLRVLAPTSLGDPGALLRTAIDDDGPVLFIENKVMYVSPADAGAVGPDFECAVVDGEDIGAPMYRLAIRDGAAPTITVAAYGHMAELARDAVLRLAYEFEVFAELIVPTQLAPVRLQGLVAATASTGRLLTVEEGTRTAGWGAEVLAHVSEALGPRLRAGCRVGAPDHPIPSSGAMEDAVLPGVDAIVKAALELP